MSARRFVTAAALCALAIACNSEELTQVVVVVDSDSDRFDRVEIEFEGLSYREPVEIDVREHALPRRITLVHDGGKLGPFAVIVSAFESGDAEPILVEPRRRLFFESGRARMLKIDLLNACLEAEAECEDDQACFAGGVCEASDSARARRLEDWDDDFEKLGVGDDTDAGSAGSSSGAGSDGSVGSGGSGGSDTAGTGGDDAGMLEPPMPTPTFPYQPSNFDPADPLIPEDRAEVVLDCDGEVTFDSTTMDFPDTCGDAPLVKVIDQSDAGGEAALLVMDTLRIEAGTTLRLVGTRPVIFAVYGGAQVLGTIDASAVADTPGAGGNNDCGEAAGADGLDAAERSENNSGPGADGAGGGAGGGFGTVGANGGGSKDTPSAAGGTTLGNASLAPLRGGCPGGNGGLGDDASVALGGAGGGAVQISAAGRLDVVGSIAANGGGGGANETYRAGGGGGGSGGAVLLEGHEIVFAASTLVVANGGGGGGGNATAGAARASAGNDGALSIAAAAGGAGPNSGGQGGSGASRASAAQDGEDAEQSSIGVDYGAGGGGGGGAGRILVTQGSACASSGTFSPALDNECGACAGCFGLPSPDCELVGSDSHSYAYCQEELSWADAQASCANVGMALAQVEDADEQDVLLDVISDETWLGARDSLDGEWSWESGTAFWLEDSAETVDGSYVDWASGQPDVDSGDVDCLAETRLGWVDLDCGDLRPYLCEL